MNWLIWFFLQCLMFVRVVEPAKDVRIVDSEHQGRVEVYYNGRWGTICDDFWDIKDARVVCQELGFAGAVEALRGSSVVDGSGQVWLYNVQCIGNESSIFNCSHRGWGNGYCGHYKDAGVRCNTEQRVSRLVGPLNEGRLEVFYAGSWGTVCDHHWDINDANVSCREMGYVGAEMALPGDLVPDGTGKIWLDNVNCIGTESSIFDCSHNGLGTHSCGHNNDAGVRCIPPDVQLRLVGPTYYAGRVEVFYNQTWGTICGSSWSTSDARVACRQLGFPDVDIVLHNWQVVDGTGQIWLNYVNCNGNEKSIYQCSHLGWGGHNCRHYHDIGVRCRKPVRISGSSNIGRVEVYSNGTWGTICDNNWDINDARVVCKELGFEDALAALQGLSVDYGSGYILLNNVQCAGSESSIFECSHGGIVPSSCDHRHDAGVHCTIPEVRLVGPKYYAGRVEVFYNQTWGTICTNSWSPSDAQVVCRQLGFPGLDLVQYSGHVVDGTGQIWLDSVNCKGNEKALYQCSHSGWGSHNCRHSQDIGVRCRKLVRIAASSNIGRVEVYSNGTWGTICDNNWDINDARVVCKELGFEDAVAALRGSSVDDGSGYILLNNVQCTGSESSISECSHGRLVPNSCDHSHDAGVHCLPHGVRLVGTENAGRVEVFYNNTWGTVCANSWHSSESSVVCRELGFPGIERVLYSYHTVDGSGQIWFDQVHCSGNEKALYQCSHNGWGEVHTCTHRNDVGVSCRKRVRLIGSSKMGRVEVYSDGSWGTICDNGWDINDARVVCKELGFENAVAALRGSSVHDGSGKISLSSVQCTGSESSISECSHGGFVPNSCSHSQDAGVHCTAPALRLHNELPSSWGNVEVYFENQWRKACGNSWDINDAKVVCRQLGFTDAIQSYYRNFQGNQSWGAYMNSIGRCSGDETSIFDCMSLLIQYCYTEIGVVCSPHVVRLNRTRSIFEGHVEVFHQGTWGKICDDSWDLYDARVVCRQLGFADAEASLSLLGSGEIWLDEVNCKGTESSIYDCVHAPWGSFDCHDGSFAGVRCSGRVTRLTDGAASYGRVEVLRNGLWGTICDYGWSEKDAEVVCRELGFTGLKRRFSSGETPPGSGPIHMSDVRCSGDETSISNCTSSSSISSSCTHERDVGVWCSNLGVRLQNHYYGRVEVYQNGKWGSICYNGWDIKDANVVCRQLGFQIASHASRASYSSVTTILLDRVSCTGDESSILECPKSLVVNNRCSSRYVANLQCSNPKSLILKGMNALVGQPISLNFSSLWSHPYMTHNSYVRLQFQCSKCSCYGTVIVLRWTSGRLSVSERNNPRLVYEGDNSLKLLRATIEDSGTYKFYVSSRVIGKYLEQNVTISGELPQITSFKATSSPRDSFSVAFACMATGKPEVTYELYEDTTLLETASDGIFNVRSIKKSNPNMSASYSCVARNLMGSNRQQLFFYFITNSTSKEPDSKAPRSKECDCKESESVESAPKESKTEVSDYIIPAALCVVGLILGIFLTVAVMHFRKKSQNDKTQVERGQSNPTSAAVDDSSRIYEVPIGGSELEPGYQTLDLQELGKDHTMNRYESYLLKQSPEDPIYVATTVA